jgi:hypothetical protein
MQALIEARTAKGVSVIRANQFQVRHSFND